MLINILAPSPFDIKTIFGTISKWWYFYIVLIAVISAIIVFAKLVKPKKSLDISKNQKLALIAVLSALSVIANAFTVGPQDYKFSLTIFINFIAGFTLGPSGGFAVGFVGDLIAGIIAPSAPYNPIIALASGLWGFFFGFAYYYFKGNIYLKTIIAAVIGQVVCSIFLNSVAMYLMYSFPKNQANTLWAYIVMRFLPQLANLAVNLAASLAFIPAILRITKKYFMPTTAKDKQTASDNTAINEDKSEESQVELVDEIILKSPDAN